MAPFEETVDPLPEPRRGQPGLGLQLERSFKACDGCLVRTESTLAPWQGGTQGSDEILESHLREGRVFDPDFIGEGRNRPVRVERRPSAPQVDIRHQNAEGQQRVCSLDHLARSLATGETSIGSNKSGESLGNHALALNAGTYRITNVFEQRPEFFPEPRVAGLPLRPKPPGSRLA